MELKKLGKLYSSSFPATITKQISNIKSYEISYRTLHTKAIVNDYITGDSIGIPFMNIIDKYKDNLIPIITEAELAPSISDFKPGNTIKIYDPDNFKEYINEILILEELV